MCDFSSFSCAILLTSYGVLVHDHNTAESRHSNYCTFRRFEICSADQDLHGRLVLTRAVHCKITMCFEILAVDEEPVVIRCLLDSGTFERASWSISTSSEVISSRFAPSSLRCSRKSRSILDSGCMTIQSAVEYGSHGPYGLKCKDTTT
jgi:hypothetical protein